MKILLRKVREFCGNKEEEKIVIHLSAAPLDEKKSFILNNKDDSVETGEEPASEQERQDDIDRRLDLAIKSGLVSESIH